MTSWPVGTGLGPGKPTILPSNSVEAGNGDGENAKDLGTGYETSKTG